MDTSTKDIIRRRKNVRTYSGESLRSVDRQKLDEFLRELGNPFNVPVKFCFLYAEEHSLSSPVIVGTEEYVATTKVNHVPQSEIAYIVTYEVTH